MKCLNCPKNIEHEMPCIFCKNIFCSYKCLRSHIIFTHNNNLLINTSNLTSKNSQSKNKSKTPIQVQNDIIFSPYLIQGIYYKQRNYDEKYNLENFIPILSGGKPKMIGGGSFGQVFLVTNTINQKLYAIKHMIKKNLSKKLNSLESIYKEIYIQSHIDHPNILPILYVKETSIDFDLVLEYAKGGSLFHYIRHRRYLDENSAFSLFIQVVNAVYFLHKNDLIHRDIKPENILMFDNNIIKLCDFGWCVKLEDGQQRGTFCGTTEYMSPELVNHEEYSKEIDIWSLGVLLYEMVHGYSPFRPDKPNFNAKDVIQNIRMHKLKFNKNISQRCKDLIYHLLDEEPERRYKVEDIFNSDFVKYYEYKKFSFPDKFLIEKYKFKISKAQNILYPKTKYELCHYRKRNNVSHNKSSSNIINQRSNIFKDNIDNDFDDNISSIEKNMTIMKNLKKKKYPSCLPEEYLKNEYNNKITNKKIEKNKSFEYFPSFTIIDNKINISLMGNSKSNRNLQALKKPYIINKSNENIYTNQLQEKEKELSKNETKIKTIIINNYFPNVVQNEYKKDKEESKNDLTYKKSFHMKPLKMSKIPTNNKNNNKINLNISKKKLNSLINFNYLMIKKHLSPKIRLFNDSKKLNNLSKEKEINDNESKIIEVNKTNYSSKIFNEIPNQFNAKENENRRIYTRNVSNHFKYDSMKNNSHYHSKDNNSQINANNMHCQTNNNIYGSFYLVNKNNNDFSHKKIKEGRIHHTKSMNLLNVNFNNDNIKSLLNSNAHNYSNNISINSENKNFTNNFDKNNRIKENNHNLNLNNIKKVNTIIYKTKQNSPLNTFNNNFVHTIFNKRKILDKRKNNLSLSNNISTLNIYDFNKVKQSNNQNNSNYVEKGNDIENKESISRIPTKKFYKIEINKNISNINSKKIENKKLNNIPKVKNINIKKNEELNLNLNKTNNNIKNKQYENCVCISHNNISKSKNIANIKNLSNKNVLKCITRNNSNRVINNEKIKLMKMEINNILSNINTNKNQYINYKINSENSFNNSAYYNEEGKKEYNQSFQNNNYKKACIIDKYTSSRNFKNIQGEQNIKTTNNTNNKIIKTSNFNNIGNKIRVIIKKETKPINNSTIPRYKKIINRVINDENNMNIINTNNNTIRGYNKFINKTDNNISILDRQDSSYCRCNK